MTGAATTALFSGAALIAAGALRARADALRRLAEQEHISGQERARRALLEERAQIARELHDVVAHHMSVIAIQAEAAPLRVHDPPPELTRGLSTIRRNTVEALTELHRVLELLRGDRAEPRPGAPQPTLDLLDGLLGGVRGAGLEVTVQETGTRRPLAQGVQLSAYRIVQEALSNVLRHAPGAKAGVVLDHRPDRLDVTVLNGPSPRPAPERPSGHGLVGMRERAAMLGGTLTAGPTPDGGYAVRASLPIREDRA